MASKLSFVEYIIEQARGAGEITYKKMFGEYGIYCNGKIVGLVCDNTLYIKRTQAGAAVCPKLKEEAPYNNAKLHFVFDDIDDKETLVRFLRETYNELPESKAKRRK